MADATHAEYGPGGTPVVSTLSCSLADNQIEVHLAPGSLLAALHGGASTIVERTTCGFGLDPAFQHIADEHGMRAVGTDETGEVRAFERVDHPFFVGTLYQPQLSSSPAAPHAVFAGLVAAARDRR